MTEVSDQLDQCPVCEHFSLLNGVCKWPHCYTHQRADYRSDRFRRRKQQTRRDQ